MRILEHYLQLLSISVEVSLLTSILNKLIYFVRRLYSMVLMFVFVVRHLIFNFILELVNKNSSRNLSLSELKALLQDWVIPNLVITRLPVKEQLSKTINNCFEKSATVISCKWQAMLMWRSQPPACDSIAICRNRLATTWSGNRLYPLLLFIVLLIYLTYVVWTCWASR